MSTLLAPAPPRERVLPLRLAGHTTDVVIRFRPGRGGDLLVCIHGFGCAKESFDSGYAAAALADLSICAVDLPGHGASGGLPEVDDVIEAYAQVVAAVAEQLAPRRLFLLGHSMGGAVGLVATHAVPVDRFISVEGNLVAADCGLVTQQTATQSRDEFVTTGYARFLTELAAWIGLRLAAVGRLVKRQPGAAWLPRRWPGPAVVSVARLRQLPGRATSTA